MHFKKSKKGVLPVISAFLKFHEIHREVISLNVDCKRHSVSWAVHPYLWWTWNSNNTLKTLFKFSPPVHFGLRKTWLHLGGLSTAIREGRDRSTIVVIFHICFDIIWWWCSWDSNGGEKSYGFFRLRAWFLCSNICIWLIVARRKLFSIDIEMQVIVAVQCHTDPCQSVLHEIPTKVSQAEESHSQGDGQEQPAARQPKEFQTSNGYLTQRKENRISLSDIKMHGSEHQQTAWRAA